MYIGAATNGEKVFPTPGRQEAGQVQERSSQAEREGGAAIEEKSASRAELPAGELASSPDADRATDNRGIRQSVESDEQANVSKGLGDRDSTRGDISPSRGVRVGVFKVTAYSNGPSETGKSPGDYGYGITKSGRLTVVGRTIAADWRVLPQGTKVYIKGVGYRVVDAIGGGINGQEIDLYMDGSPEDLSTWGVQYLEVYVVGKEG